MFRGPIWLLMTGAKEMLQEKPNLYKDAFDKVFGNYPRDSKQQGYSSVNPRIVAEFGGKFKPGQHFLTEQGIEAAKRVLCILAAQNPEVDYCPVLPDLGINYTLKPVLTQVHSNDFVVAYG